MATLVYRWKFDEGTGQYAYDSVSNLAAKLYTTNPGDRGVVWTPNGYNGAGLSCDGNNNSADQGALVQTTLAAPPNDFSWTLWYKTAVAQNKALLCLNRDVDLDDPIENLSLNFQESTFGHAYIAFHYWYTGGGITVQYGGTTDNGYDNGQWHFLAVTSQDAVTKLYIDDCNNAKDTQNNEPRSASGTYRWRIGGGADRNNVVDGAFNGLIDDVRIYSGALTSAEICALAKPPVANALMFSCNT